MAQEYRLFLDGTEYFDLPPELLSFEKTIIREGGINNDEQILRTKTELDYTFYGDCFNYMCGLKQNGLCAMIEVEIWYKCGNSWRVIFYGLISLVTVITDVKKCLIRAKIRDNSFSGLIREKANQKVWLSATKSADGTPIASCTKRTVKFFYNDISTPPPVLTFTAIDRDVYDVYEVFKFLVKYYTNDTVTCKSDYFTTGSGFQKYAIAMGGMIANGNTWTYRYSLVRMMIPQLNLNDFFKEIRKKLHIYMAVETDSAGNVFLRIEPETYFFNQTNVLTIPDIPLDLVETIDTSQVLSSISVGSKDTKVDDGNYYTFAEVFLQGWIEENFNNCSTCIEENNLNLVSDYIIDSNVILYTQSNPDTASNTVNGDRIFLIETDDTIQEALWYLDNVDGYYYYNYKLNNENVLTNWAGGIPECVLNTIDLTPCVDLAVVPTITYQHEFNLIGTQVTIDLVEFADETCNTLGAQPSYPDTAFEISDNGAFCSNVGTIYQAPFDGVYAFTAMADATNVFTGKSTVIGCIGEFYEWKLRIYVFNGLSDITGSGTPTPLFTFSDDYTVPCGGGNKWDDPYNNAFSISTGDLNLVAGNIVIATFIIRTQSTFIEPMQDSVRLNSGSFEMTKAEYDINDLNFVPGNGIINPYQWDFTYPLNDNDYQTIENAPYGYIDVKGAKGWIKQIDYRPGKVSTFKLLGERTLC